MGCFLERALAHLPGYLNGLTVGIHGEQRGRWGNKHETGLPLASPEGSFASRCHSRKLGKCLTLLSQGLIPTRRTGQIGQHSTHQKEVWRRNEIDSDIVGGINYPDIVVLVQRYVTCNPGGYYLRSSMANTHAGFQGTYPLGIWPPWENQSSFYDPGTCIFHCELQF